LDPGAPNIGEQVRGLAGDGFEVLFEASGAPRALRQAFRLVRPGATLVQIGTLGTDDVPLPANQVMSRELKLVGSFRYGNDFGGAVELAVSGRFDLEALVTNTFPLESATAALELAASKANVLKIQLAIQ
jgi:L-idonate 5-dehydrogenase